jgi:HSP20 family protein
MARRYTTLLLASRLQREIDQLFQEIGQATEALDAADWQPAIDVYETEEAVHVLADLPGVDPAQVELEVAGNLLTLRGRKNTLQTNPRRARFQCVETGRGRFERQLRIETPVNTHRATAELRDGLLLIVLPKVADRRRASQRVKIQSD